LKLKIFPSKEGPYINTNFGRLGNRESLYISPKSADLKNNPSRKELAFDKIMINKYSDLWIKTITAPFPA